MDQKNPPLQISAAGLLGLDLVPISTVETYEIRSYVNKCHTASGHVTGPFILVKVHLFL